MAFTAVCIGAVLAAPASAMALSTHSATATRPGDPPLGGCNETSVTGVVQNETGHPLRLVEARHGITNTWCTRPSDEVPAHSSSNRWKAGDDFLFNTEVVVAYSFGHGIEVQFFAGTRGLGAGCGFLTPVPVPYGCEAIDFGGSKKHPVFAFRVFPKRQNQNGVNGQPRTRVRSLAAKCAKLGVRATPAVNAQSVPDETIKSKVTNCSSATETVTLTQAIAGPSATRSAMAVKRWTITLSPGRTVVKTRFFPYMCCGTFNVTDKVLTKSGTQLAQAATSFVDA
jgi:hypothetical protein